MHARETRAVSHPATMRPEDWLRFVQIDPFPRQWKDNGLDDDDLKALEIGIMAGPSRPPVVPGSNGLRKLRFAKASSGMGKRGAFRVFYVYFAEYGTVILWAILGKSDQPDLTRDDIKFLGQQIARLKALLDGGKIR